MGSKKIHAFTLAEMLVTLALTSMMVSFCYLSYNYIQKLLQQFNQQSFFITQLNELDKRLGLITKLPGTIVNENEDTFVFNCDSSTSSLALKKNLILLRRFNQTDTFHMSPEKISTAFEPMVNPAWQNKLVNQLEFDIYFQKQKFHLTFHKHYDAVTKLNLEKEN